MGLARRVETDTAFTMTYKPDGQCTNIAFTFEINLFRVCTRNTEG